MSALQQLSLFDVAPLESAASVDSGLYPLCIVFNVGDSGLYPITASSQEEARRSQKTSFAPKAPVSCGCLLPGDDWRKSLDGYPCSPVRQ